MLCDSSLLTALLNVQWFRFRSCLSLDLGLRFIEKEKTGNRMSRDAFIFWMTCLTIELFCPSDVHDRSGPFRWLKTANKNDGF